MNVEPVCLNYFLNVNHQHKRTNFTGYEYRLEIENIVNNSAYVIPGYNKYKFNLKQIYLVNFVRAAIGFKNPDDHPASAQRQIVQVSHTRPRNQIMTYIYFYLKCAAMV